MSNSSNNEYVDKGHHILYNSKKYLLRIIRIETNKNKHWKRPTKNLEKDIDQDWYSLFQQTTSELDPTDIKTAFKKTLTLTEKLFDNLGVEAKLKGVLRRIE